MRRLRRPRRYGRLMRPRGGHLMALFDALELKEQTKRLFSEITKNAIQEAIQHLEDTRTRWMHSRHACKDRTGFELSPVLWRQAGPLGRRVQSVAVRLIVEREREIQRLKLPIVSWPSSPRRRTASSTRFAEYNKRLKSKEETGPAGAAESINLHHRQVTKPAKKTRSALHHLNPGGIAQTGLRWDRP